MRAIKFIVSLAFLSILLALQHPGIGFCSPGIEKIHEFDSHIVIDPDGGMVYPLNQRNHDPSRRLV